MAVSAEVSNKAESVSWHRCWKTERVHSAARMVFAQGMLAFLEIFVFRRLQMCHMQVFSDFKN